MKPKLRFKEFIDEWEEKKISDIYTITRGKVLSKKNIHNIGLYPVYSSQTLKHGLLGYYDDYLFENAITWTTDGANAGTVSYREGKFYCTNVCGVLLNNDGYSNQCMAEILNSVAFRYVSRVGNPKLMNNVMSEIIVFFPSLSEQEKIGQFLSLVDKRIEKQEQRIELLKERKKGWMQKIFNQEIRFKDENGNDYPDWEEKKLEELAEYRRGSFPQPYTNKDYYDEINGMPFIQVVDVKANMKLNKDTKQHISKKAEDKSVFVPKNSVIVTIQGSIGRVAITQYDAYMDRTLLVFQQFLESINKQYFAYEIERIFNIEKKKAPGGTIKTITKAVLSSFIVNIPSLPEQEKIGAFLSKQDELIEQEEKKLELLKEQKKGLLQQMFV